MEKENKLEKLFANARTEKQGMELQEVLNSVNKASQNKQGIIVKHIFKLRWLIMSGAAAATIIFSSIYFMNNNKPEQKALKPLIKNMVPPVLENTIDEPGQQSSQKTATSLVAKEKKVNLTDDVKSLEQISINDSAGAFTLYFKNSELVEVHLNNNKIAKKNWIEHAEIINKASEVRKSYTEFDKTQDYNTPEFQSYMRQELKKRGILNEHVSAINFSKNSVSLDSIKLDNALFMEILEKYKDSVQVNE